MVVLDTDHLTLLEWERLPATERLRTRLRELTAEEKATTIISFEEQMRGWMAYLARTRTLPQEVEAYRRLKQQLVNFSSISVLEFDERAATEFQRLRSARLRVGTMDLKIAAIVLVHNALLLSRNAKDFGKVPRLRVEDWTV